MTSCASFLPPSPTEPLIIADIAFLSTGISVMVPNSHTIDRSTDPSTNSSTLFFGWSEGARQGPVCPDPSPETADRGLPLGSFRIVQQPAKIPATPAGRCP